MQYSLPRRRWGGKRIGEGSRFCFLLRASQQNGGDSPARKPPRQAHRSLCNASPCPHSTGVEGVGGGRREVSKQGRVQECTSGQSTPRRGTGAAPYQLSGCAASPFHSLLMSFFPPWLSFHFIFFSFLMIIISFLVAILRSRCHPLQLSKASKIFFVPQHLLCEC